LRYLIKDINNEKSCGVGCTKIFRNGKAMKIVYKINLGFLFKWMFILNIPIMFIHNMNAYYFFPLNLWDMNFDVPIMFCFCHMK